MASVSLPPQSQLSVFSQPLDPIDNPLGRRHSSGMSAPLPNPHFVFPARSPDADDNAHSTVPEPHAGAPQPLPAFSFNSGSNSGHAPQPSTGASGRAGGHRRQYSEFVGGEQLVSPEMEASYRNDEKPASASGPEPRPGGHRKRGHAHRRSGAVSSVDLATIAKALETKQASESEPCTPAHMQLEHARDDLARPMSQSATSLSRETPPASPKMPVVNPATEPDMDNSHSAKHSLSTIVSEASGKTPETEPDMAKDNGPGPASDEPSIAIPKRRVRPKTADAYLTFDSAKAGDTDDAKVRPSSASGHSRSHKSMSSGILDSAKQDLSCDFYRPRRRFYSEDESSDTSVDGGVGSSDLSATAKENNSIEKRQKQTRVRSWAEAIFSRSKEKLHQPKKEPTASKPSSRTPVLTRTNSDYGSGLDVDFDDDNIVVLRTPTDPNIPESGEATEDAAHPPSPPSLENSWKPRSFYEQGRQDEALSPIIDLDAALGPFNTPGMRSGFVGSNFEAATRRMYSGGRRGQFIGPEMRFHRRTESAPEMPPVDRTSLPANRLAPNSDMESADVFYEEEEDAFLAASGQSPDSPTPVAKQPIDGGSVSSEGSSDTLTRHTVDGRQNQGLGISGNAPAEPQNAEEGSMSGHPFEQFHQAENPFSQSKSPVEIVRHEDWHKTPVPPSPDISPRFSPADRRPGSSPLELSQHVPPLSLQGGRSLQSFSVPSPDFHYASSDAQRSIKTPSTTDRKFSGPLPTGHSHASIEDVPSLTSSTSTRTNTMHRLSATFFPRGRFSTDRSASLSAAVNRPTSQSSAAKRSSFASLSKLVVGTHPERSKLRYEEKPPGDAPDKTRKTSRRISRLMHFWRGKDRDKSNDSVSRR